MTRILITGGAGFLAYNIAPELGTEHEISLGWLKTLPDARLGRPIALDVTRPSQVAGAFDELKPTLVIHAAAMSRPDECESRPEEARRVIVEGTRNVAQACVERGCRLVHISTDLVFDGSRSYYTEKDDVHGISVYSKSKIQAEKVAAELAPASVILRIALLYGKGTAAHPGLIEQILDKWRSGQPVTFYADQYRTPLFAPHVADAIKALLARPRAAGVFHVAGADRVSRFAFAQILAERVNAPSHLLRRGSMWDNKTAAPRGADCSMTTLRLQRELGIEPLTCSKGLTMLVESGHLKPLESS